MSYAVVLEFVDLLDCDWELREEYSLRTILEVDDSRYCIYECTSMDFSLLLALLLPLSLLEHY